jgi:hypothetical protein
MGSKADPRYFGGNKNHLPLPGIETRFLGHQTHSQVTIGTTLSEILFKEQHSSLYF